MRSRSEIISWITLPQVLIPLVIILWLYWLWCQRRFYKFSLNFPTRWGIPIFGILPILKTVNNVLPIIAYLFKMKKENTICVWAGFYPMIITKDIDFIDFVLNSNEFIYKSEIMYGPIHKAFRGGLITNKYEQWKYIRPLIEPCFNRRTLLSLFPLFNESKTALMCKMKDISDGRRYDLDPIFKDYISTLTMKTTMGNRIDDDKIATRAYQQNFEETLKISFIKTFFGVFNLGRVVSFYGYRAANATVKFVHELTKHYIKEKENNNESEESTSNIFIKHAIKLYEKNQLTWKQIIGESNTMVAASFETTANALYSLIVMIAMFPDVHQKVYEELKSVFPDPNCVINYEDLGKLSYLDLVLKEVLRLIPPVPLIGRHLRRGTNMKHSPIALPADIEVMICIFHLHRRTDIWGPDAAEFKPSRFFEENITTEQRRAYMPFSKGARNCIGFRYAQLALKVFAAGLLLNFKFETDFKFKDLRFSDYITMRYITRPFFTIKEINC